MITAGRVVVGLACLALWQAAHLSLGAEWISRPADIAWRVAEIAASGELMRHTAATLGEAALGFVLGGGAGILLPFALRASPRLTAALDPFFTAAMGVPKLALAPLLILWFGIGLVSKVVFVAAVVFFFLFFNVLAGVRSIDPRLASAVRVLGGREWTVTREIAWQTALPYVFSGLKVALPRAISAAVVGEFIAADRGLGYYINNARAMADPVGLFTGVTLVTALVLALDAGLERLQARSLAWRPLTRDVGV
ncbi:MAG: ABC transporter permease [Candidatus Rokuibacteriota bacterium]